MATALTLVAFVAGAPVVQAAADGVTATSHSRFHLRPDRHRVEVTVVLKLTNHIPLKVRFVPCRGARSSGCRRLVETPVTGWPIVIQSQAQDVRFSGRGATKRVHTRGELVTLYVPRFKPIRRGQTGTIRVTYNLPTGRPHSPGRTRVTDAYAHFCWHGQATDRGTVKAILPSRFKPSAQQRQVRTTSSAARTVVQARRSRNLEGFGACTDFFDPSALVRTVTTPPSGQTVVVEGWPEDPAWADGITLDVADVLPRLETLAGTPMPSGELVIRQVASQALAGYAGEFDRRLGLIRVGEHDDDPVTVAHELAHAWFNSSTMVGDWMIEGSADWLASAANEVHCERPGPYPGKGSPRLRAWRYLGPTPTGRQEAIVSYQYAASCTIVEEVERLIGREATGGVIASLLERRPKYGGSSGGSRPGWREWLDAVDEVGLVPAGVQDLRAAERLLVAQGVVRRAQLKGRADARARYHETMAGPMGEVIPVFVRDLMDEWRFGKAVAALGVIDRIGKVLQRPVAATAPESDVDVHSRMAGASSLGDLRQLLRDLRADPGAHHHFTPKPPTGTPAEAEPTYAPEDMYFALPRSVGSLELKVHTVPGDLFAEGIGIDKMRDLLIPLGRDSSDIHAAIADADRDEDGQTILTLIALRVDGLAGDSIAGPLLDLVDSDVPLTREYIDGRSVAVGRRRDPSAWLFVYSKGEVVFLGVGAMPEAGIALREVLAELP